MSIYYKKLDNTWTELTNNMHEIRYTKVECDDKFVRKPTKQKLTVSFTASNKGTLLYDHSYWITDTLYFFDIAFVYSKLTKHWEQWYDTLGIAVLDGASFNCGTINVSSSLAWPTTSFIVPRPEASNKTELILHVDPVNNTYDATTLYLTGVLGNV